MNHRETMLWVCVAAAWLGGCGANPTGVAGSGQVSTETRQVVRLECFGDPVVAVNVSDNGWVRRIGP